MTDTAPSEPVGDPAGTPDAQAAEAADESIRFTWKDMSFTAPPQLKWPGRAMRIWGSRSNAANLLVLVLGEEQYLPFERRPDCDVQAVLDLYDALNDAMRITAGEATASAGS